MGNRRKTLLVAAVIICILPLLSFIGQIGDYIEYSLSGVREPDTRKLIWSGAHLVIIASVLIISNLKIRDGRYVALIWSALLLTYTYFPARNTIRYFVQRTYDTRVSMLYLMAMKDEVPDTAIYDRARGSKLKDDDLFGIYLYRGLFPGMQEIIDRGFDLSNKPYVCDVLYGGEMDKLYFLIKNGAPVNCRCGRYDETPLFIAVRHGYREATDMLLANGANVLALDSLGQTVLFHAVGKRPGRYDYELTEILINRGIDVNHTNKYGFDALYSAVSAGNTEGVKLLLAQGADPGRVYPEDKQLMALKPVGKNPALKQVLLDAGLSDEGIEYPEDDNPFIIWFDRED